MLQKSNAVSFLVKVISKIAQTKIFTGSSWEAFIEEMTL